MPVSSLEEIIQQFKVAPDQRLKLKNYDPGWAGDPDVPKAERRQLARNLLNEDVSELATAQELLYASNKRSVLLIFQAMDAAGKDGTIKHVMSGVNPQGCQVFSFKQPSAEDLDHNFLWRYSRALPERGRIGIFNRSYYEEVLVVRVHPEWIEKQRLPDADPQDPKFWEARFEDINTFERHLVRNGTLVLKFFLNVSLDEQRERFLDRLNDPSKQWKFSAADLAERARWDDYMKSYEAAINATSTEWAPWYVVPADHKWVTRAVVAAVLTRSIHDLKLEYPEVTERQRQEIEVARSALGETSKSASRPGDLMESDSDRNALEEIPKNSKDGKRKGKNKDKDKGKDQSRN